MTFLPTSHHSSEGRALPPRDRHVGRRLSSSHHSLCGRGHWKRPKGPSAPAPSFCTEEDECCPVTGLVTGPPLGSRAAAGLLQPRSATQVGGVTAPRAAALSADEPVLAGGVSRRHRAQREPELAGAACRGARHAPADTPSEGVWRAAPFQGAPVTPRLPSGHRTHSEAFSWRR